MGISLDQILWIVSALILGMGLGAVIPYGAWWFITFRQRCGRLPFYLLAEAHSTNTQSIFDQQKQKMIQQLRFLPYLTSCLLGGSMAGLTLQYSSIELIINAIFLCVLLFVSLTDQWFFLVPNEVIWFGTLFFMGMRYWQSPSEWISDLIAMMLVYLLGLCISRITGGLGLGDVKLLAMAVWVLGGVGVILSFWFGTIAALLMAGRQRWKGYKDVLKQPMPFVPHLSIGMLISLFVGEALWDWYMATFFLME